MGWVYYNSSRGNSTWIIKQNQQWFPMKSLYAVLRYLVFCIVKNIYFLGLSRSQSIPT